MPLKQRPAYVVVQRVGEVLVENLDASLDVVRRELGARLLVLHLLRFIRLFDAADEERDEPRQAVLVHRIDDGEVADAEKEHGRPRRDRPVLLSGLVDVPLRDLGLGDLLRDVVGGDLGLREGIYELLVVENVPGAVAQHVQDLILEVLELRLHARVGHHELVLRLGEVAPLLHHHRAEELILQAVERDEKVEQRNLHAHLWLIVWVAHLGRHVEPEVRVVGDDVVAHLDHLAAALLERLLLQQGLERGVQLFADVLE